MSRKFPTWAVASLVLLPFAAGWLRGAAAARALSQAPAARSTYAQGWPYQAQPAAAAYFPLLDANLTSAWPGGAYAGEGFDVSWRRDPVFGTVLACDEAAGSHVYIPGLRYGQGGGLAVVFWAQFDPAPGTSMDYAYFHSASGSTDPSQEPNLVAVYLPEPGHPDFGVVRAMLRDAADVRTNGTAPFYIDSNGCVSSSPDCTPAPSSLTFDDSGWHMVGLTSRPEGGKGFQLFVDGQLAAEAREGQTYTDADGFNKTATGGGPMELTGNITLCGRSDLDPSRFYTGSLAHLFIYNTSLTAADMMRLYEAGIATASAASASRSGGGAQQAAQAPTAPPAAGASAPGPQPAAGCVTPCTTYNDLPVCANDVGELLQCTQGDSSAPAAAPAGGPQLDGMAAAANAGTPPPSSPGSQPQQATNQGAALLGGQPLCSLAPIEGVTTVRSCGEGYICAALSRQQLATNFGSALGVAVGDIGVCAYAPNGVLLPSSDDVPPARAFFPLNSQSLQSFPLPEYSGSASGAGVVEDPLFGSALVCSEGDSDLVALDPVQYARSGAFTVNLWFLPGNMSGDALSYLFSHRGTSEESDAASNTGWGPNQIQMYLPEEGHPSHGVLRAYVKDYNDLPATQGAQTWLDSDGNVAFNGERSIPPSASLYDGGWHMATLSSQPGGGRGYRLYVDGELRGEVAEGRSYASPDGFPIPVDGGDPILLDGNVVLCVRSDDPQGRHYDGRLAYLSLYDVALNETQVGLLYSAVANKPTAAEAPAPAGQELPILAPSGAAPKPSRVSTSGLPCQFPALYGGELVTDCVLIGGTPQCQVDDGVWEPCADAAAGGAADAAAAGVPGYDTSSPSRGAATPGSTGSDSPIIVTEGGIQCQLPLNYSGVQVEGCVSIGGAYQCWGMETDAWEACPSDLLQSQPAAGDLGAEAAGAALPVVPSLARRTVSGEPCRLPTVHEGELLADCVQQGGARSCLSAVSGDWQQCDMRGPQAIAGENGQLLVAQRTTDSGGPCLLPVVYRGRLFYDCVDYGDPQTGTAEICPTQAAAWERCSAVTGSDLQAAPFSAAAALDRSEPGRLGMLCALGPSGQPAAGCGANLTCVPLPQLGENVTTDWQGAGFCQEEPQGGTRGALQPFQQGAVPPLAFFPLTGGSLGSLLLPAYNGSLSGMPLPSWVPDPTFGSVLNCSRSGQSAVLLDSVPYARNGSFALSLWMRRLPGSNTSGDLFQYLYSHTGTEQQARLGGQTPNKVALYLPERGHPAYGVVRAIVSDASDVRPFQPEPTFLDSDGQLGRPDRAPSHADVNDGGWHMVAVSTHPNGTRGFSLYVDGAQVASLSPAGSQPGATAPDATGGDPARLTDSIVLCARSDLDADRSFDGSVAHLMLFSSALQPGQVADLYAAYAANGTGSGGGPPVTAAAGDPDAALAAAGSSSGGQGLTGGEIAGITIASVGGALALLTGVAMVARSRRQRSRGRFERFNDDALAAAAYHEATHGGGRVGGATVVPMAAVTAPSIQMSSGGSKLLGGKDFDEEHDDLAAGGPSRPYPALSDVSTRAPSLAGDGDDAASMASARSRLSDSVAIEPGKRGLLKRGSARVVLPGVEEGDDARGAFDP